jgi:hypothetical protein
MFSFIYTIYISKMLEIRAGRVAQVVKFLPKIGLKLCWEVFAKKKMTRGR